VENNAQEGSVDVETAIVLNEAQFLEFIHEEIDTGARGPDHFRQRLLRYFGNHFVRMVLLARSLPPLPEFFGLKDVEISES
jgi:hypothetical protein